MVIRKTKTEKKKKTKNTTKRKAFCHNISLQKQVARPENNV